MVLPITFDAPLETAMHAAAYPVLYPLVELKDRFNRFVVVLTTSESARIIEMSLGSASTVLLAERPELQKRFGREWTREHYVNHRRERSCATRPSRWRPVRADCRPWLERPWVGRVDPGPPRRAVTGGASCSLHRPARQERE